MFLTFKVLQSFLKKEKKKPTDSLKIVDLKIHDLGLINNLLTQRGEKRERKERGGEREDKGREENRRDRCKREDYKRGQCTEINGVLHIRV